MPSHALLDPSTTIPPLVARTAVLQMARPRGGIVCDLSAAALWQFPLPVAVAEVLSTAPVANTRGDALQRDRHAGSHGRRVRIPSGHVTQFAGVELTRPARTWIDCAALVSFEFLTAMGDFALRSNLVTPRELEEMIRWGHGRRGIKAARASLPQLDPRSESPRESWLRASLFRLGVPKPEVNVNVFADGLWLARVDLAWPDFRVALEYDGIAHHGPERGTYDQARRDRLRAAGWIVLVVTNDDLGDPLRIATNVLAALSLRGWPR